MQPPTDTDNLMESPFSIDSPNPFVVHTSERILFRRCRRKWDLQSPNRRNLTWLGDPSPHLWFGSGYHFALEDWHGYNFYSDPFTAFLAYCYARRDDRPSESSGMIDLAYNMLQHYRRWLKRRNEFHTLWIDGRPQVEVEWEIPFDGFSYGGTFDRIVTDAHGRYWILDWKTAQRFNTSKLEMDPQISAYAMAFEKLYGAPMEGMVYMQFMKTFPEPPIILQSGEFSLNKNQNTCYELYRDALLARYGNRRAFIPRAQYQFCMDLQKLESPEGDKFIRRDLVRRNAAHVASEEWKIQAEAAEMMNPLLPLYPNPTRDCSWDCDFRGVCVAMDDGGDWEAILEAEYQRKEEMHSWRKALPILQDLEQWVQERSLPLKLPPLRNQES